LNGVVEKSARDKVVGWVCNGEESVLHARENNKIVEVKRPHTSKPGILEVNYSRNTRGHGPK
jgi:hypothetical protein